MDSYPSRVTKYIKPTHTTGLLRQEALVYRAQKQLSQSDQKYFSTLHGSRTQLKKGNWVIFIELAYTNPVKTEPVSHHNPTTPTATRGRT